MEKPDLTDLIFLCLHGQGPYLICATWEEKNWIGSLEPCCVNAAFGKLPTTITQVQTVFVPGFVVFGLHGVLQYLWTHFLATLVRWRAWPYLLPTQSLQDLANRTFWKNPQQISHFRPQKSEKSPGGTELLMGLHTLLMGLHTKFPAPVG